MCHSAAHRAACPIHDTNFHMRFLMLYAHNYVCVCVCVCVCAGQRAEGELPRHLTSRAEAAAHHAELHTTLLNAKLKRERVARVCTKCPRPHGRSSRGEHSSQSPSAREAPDKPSPRARGTGGLRVSNRVPHCLAVAVSEVCQLSKICRKSVVLSKICRKSVVQGPTHQTRDQPTRF